MENKTLNIQILHLEDNPLDAELILHELGKGKLIFNLKRVETRDDFVSALENFKPHIILGDYSLPQFDGISALTLTLENMPNIPFIFVSGFIGEEKAIETLKLGATDYVLKDHLARLVPAISRALEEANQRQKRKEAENTLAARNSQIRKHQEALLKLVKIRPTDLSTSIQTLIETGAKTLEIERVSIWFFNGEHSEISCQYMNSLKPPLPEPPRRLKAMDYPRYFKSLEEGRLIAANDARHDPCTSEFTENYLKPLGITSMMDVPIRLNGHLLGVLCHESTGPIREWTLEEQNFASSITDLVALNLEIFERIKAEKNLKQRTIELQRSNKELEQFAYVASHDLNEPLYIIRAFIDNIKQQPSAKFLDAKIGHALDRIEHGAQRMELLIKNLLEFARINMRSKPFEPVNLGALADEIIFELDLRLKETGATVRLGKLPTVWADKTQIQQLFQNMILNALKFRKKEVPLQIDITGRELNGEFVEISIRDNGIGFDQEYAEKIFLPFQRLHSRSEYEGSGIGLALCHKIVSRHNGTISAQGKSGEGAIFTLTLQKERSGVGS